ncbi:hypothetical protein [Amycolatopsis nigrescens]|uniref:hypothetical protein n=1 Tax=Amycolatopsis nigrescens TaxID=381445 RepID=UPI00036E2487|nr:hypothetical protein [Amycolatopsis nigrescens]
MPGAEARGFQWALALLPAFPIVLLVLRLWHLSRQDLHTMLLLVQNVGPLDLVSSLVITLMWVPPAFLLAGQMLGLLYIVSAADRRDSWLSKTTDRTRDWVLAVTAMWAAIAWELRFLPALLMLTLAIVGLTVRRRHPGRPRLIRAVCVVLPLVAAAAEYAWFGPAIVQAVSDGETVLVLLLLLPPILAPLLTGPIPARVARAATHAPAAGAALLAPFLLLALFLRAPVLPSVALELTTEPGRPAQIVLGNVVSVDDTMTTLLDDHGAVRFVANRDVASKALCQGSERVPSSAVSAHRWQVEESALEWLLPSAEPASGNDSRCAGRPLLPSARLGDS